MCTHAQPNTQKKIKREGETKEMLAVNVSTVFDSGKNGYIYFTLATGHWMALAWVYSTQGWTGMAPEICLGEFCRWFEWFANRFEPKHGVLEPVYGLPLQTVFTKKRFQTQKKLKFILPITIF